MSPFAVYRADALVASPPLLVAGLALLFCGPAVVAVVRRAP